MMLPEKHIVLNKGEVTKDIPSDGHGTFPESFQELEQLLESFATRLSSHPISSLVIKLRFPEEIRPGDQIEIGIEFHNTGPQKAVFSNPRFIGDQAGGRLVIELWENVRSEDGRPYEDLAQSIDCRDYELLVSPEEALPSDQRTLELDSGDSLTTHFSFRFPKCTPNSYRACGIFQTMASENEEVQDFVSGLYHTDVVPFSVSPLRV